MCSIKYCNKTWKKIIVSIFLTLKATILNKHCNFAGSSLFTSSVHLVYPVYPVTYGWPQYITTSQNNELSFDRNSGGHCSRKSRQKIVRKRGGNVCGKFVKDCHNKRSCHVKAKRIFEKI